MQATIALILGIVVGGIVLAVVGRGITASSGSQTTPTPLGWSAFVLGVLALLVLVSAVLRISGVSAPISIMLAVAAMVVGIGAFVKHDRHWPTWVGLIVGALPTIFWIAFLVGELIGPAH